MSARRFEPNLQVVRAIINGGVPPHPRVHKVYSLGPGDESSVGSPARKRQTSGFKLDAMKHSFSSDNAPKAIGPYSQAVRVGDLLFLSGQVPLDPATSQMIEGDISAQTRRVMDNLGAVLKSAGLSFAQVARTTIFLTDMNDFAKVNEVYGSYFTEPFPARATVQVARLPKDARVEIDAIAFLLESLNAEVRV